jgi:hypothetical protein
MSDDEAKPTPLKTEILDKISALVTAAFGLVAALAWNDAIKAVFKEVFGSADAIGPMLIYAILVTIIAVILTVTVANTASKAKSMMQEKTFECKLCDFTSKIESKFIEHTIKEHAASQDKFLSK